MFRAGVPEAAINKYGDLVPRKHEVWGTAHGKFSVQSEAKPGRVQHLS
jgi:hypothetical protein